MSPRSGLMFTLYPASKPYEVNLFPFSPSPLSQQNMMVSLYMTLSQMRLPLV